MATEAKRYWTIWVCDCKGKVETIDWAAVEAIEVVGLEKVFSVPADFWLAREARANRMGVAREHRLDSVPHDLGKIGIVDAASHVLAFIRRLVARLDSEQQGADQ